MPFVTNRALRAGSEGHYFTDAHGELEAGHCRVGFEENDRRAALLQHRLQIDGRFLLFSWLASNYLTYGEDVSDMRRGVFLESAPLLLDKASDITVYMSDSDRVLMLSAAVNVDEDRVHFVDVTAAGAHYPGGEIRATECRSSSWRLICACRFRLMR